MRVAYEPCATESDGNRRAVGLFNRSIKFLRRFFLPDKSLSMR